MIDDKDINFEKAMLVILGEYKNICPLTPCEVYDKYYNQIDLDYMSLTAMPVAIYVSIYVFSEGFIERKGCGYKLTYPGWQEIRRIEKIIKKERDYKVKHIGGC